MSNAAQLALPWHRREDTWAVFIALGLVLGVTAAFFAGASTWVGSTALSFPTWSGGLAKVTAALGAAFAAGVLVNVPLGYWLSTHVFASYWLGVK